MMALNQSYPEPTGLGGDSLGNPASGGRLLENLVLFGRLLRALGLDINPGRVIDLATALGYIDIGRRVDFYHTARSLLVHRAEDLTLFDLAFNHFWQVHFEGWSPLNFPGPGIRKEPPLMVPPAFQVRRKQDQQSQKPKTKEGEERLILEVTRTYSPEESLRELDFSAMTGEELEAVKQLISEINWQLGMRETRRKQPGSGDELDIRRTFRASMKYGGEILKWDFRRRKQQPRPLVIIADVSGSMERYTRLLLHFVYGLAEGLANRVEVFVFSTRLTRITRDLRHKDIDFAVRQVSRQVPDWSGGTRIGEAVRTFNFTWGRRVLGRGAVVLMISDGWDRGEIDLLRREMDRLQRSCHRLIWLNPLLGSPEYQPLTRGIQAALPYIDDFLPVHNLLSLEDLADRLRDIGSARPARRQNLPFSRHV
ncbi:MAG TPA: VWA domain-containing protein [Anaerolineales bacterium]|nr:VWA domain-containing protein [Anaerolineales bacterium]